MAQTILPNFQAGFRLFAGEDLNQLVTRTNALGPTVAYNTNTATGNTVLTGANITGGRQEVYLNMTGTLTGAGNIQLPTVAALVTALQAAGIQPSAGDSYTLIILNTGAGAFAWTVTTNTGWTALNGTMTINQNFLRMFVVTLTSLTAAVLQSLGTQAVASL